MYFSHLLPPQMGGQYTIVITIEFHLPHYNELTLHTQAGKAKDKLHYFTLELHLYHMSIHG